MYIIRLDMNELPLNTQLQIGRGLAHCLHAAGVRLGFAIYTDYRPLLNLCAMLSCCDCHSGVGTQTYSYIHIDKRLVKNYAHCRS